MHCPILQFGTSRFLQAHVDLFVSEARKDGQDCGPIAVVQTTASADSRRRLAFFDRGQPYQVHVRGLAGGAAIDERIEVSSIARGIAANHDWAALEDAFVNDARWIVSNTGDRGFELDAGDAVEDEVPKSFPAKLTRLLNARFRAGRPAPTIFPCELILGNGDRLKALALGLAQDWKLGDAFADWLARDCLWVNSLVDRIVSEPLEPAGAVAEPYALWAVAKQPGLVMPCTHRAIVLTDDLERYERLKLFILNLGHTWLAEGWGARGGDKAMTVRALLSEPAALADLNDLYDSEVLPVFAGIGLGDEALAYRNSVIERFRNPFLNHFLADIHTNHAAKKARRFGGIIALKGEHGLDVPQPRLTAALKETN